MCQFYGQRQSQEARDDFERTFSERKIPKNICKYYLKGESREQLFDLLLTTQLVSSKNEGRRLLRGGAISIDGQKIEDENWVPKEGVLKIGKRRFLKLAKRI